MSVLSRSGLFLSLDEEHGQQYELIWPNKEMVTNRIVDHEVMSVDCYYDLMIKDSRNGLLLCVNMSKVSRTSKTIVVYNPSTAQHTPENYRKKYAYLRSFSLVFNPLKSLDYKIVLIWGSRFEIYSSETKCWRLCEGNFDTNNDVFRSPGLLWDGCLNWFNRENWDLVYFNIEEQVLKTLPFNPIDDNDDERRADFVMYFGVFMGHMYLVQSAQPIRTRTRIFDIFEMEVDHQGWQKKYVFNSDELSGPISILSLEKGDDEDEEALKVFTRSPRQIVSYDLKRKRFEDIRQYPKSSPFQRQFTQSQRQSGYDCIEHLQMCESLP